MYYILFYLIKSSGGFTASNINDKFGQNAGKIWRTLNSHGVLTKRELISKTNLSIRDFYSALGWLARENKIFQKKDLYAVDIKEFNNLDFDKKIELDNKEEMQYISTMKKNEELNQEKKIENKKKLKKFI